MLFDALILPDGESGVGTLDGHAHPLQFLRLQYWHCKPILAFGALQALLADAQIPMTLADGSPDEGLILANAADADEAVAACFSSMAAHRHYGRDNQRSVA
ncbi:hypothetical protein QTI24_29480 [Variovorax sp. J22P240]|uniref:hypothetical protein n=1 Tax=Variovorax sp. J22P240 TaxID=3053514 RepID=UPI002577F8E9|nr:hypothetical protein [Variovorax sp. J22P240]MDM0002759.1 hypothetical protein [Variovorax sp. J22P240]